MQSEREESVQQLEVDCGDHQHCVVLSNLSGHVSKLGTHRCMHTHAHTQVHRLWSLFLHQLKSELSQLSSTGLCVPVVVNFHCQLARVSWAYL